MTKFIVFTGFQNGESFNLLRPTCAKWGAIENIGELKTEIKRALDVSENNPRSTVYLYEATSNKWLHVDSIECFRDVQFDMSKFIDRQEIDAILTS